MTPVTPSGPRVQLRQIPNLLQYEVRDWARGAGADGARLAFNHALKVWVVEIPYRENDPRREGFQDGRLMGEPVEMVHVPFDPIEAGAEALRQFLDRGNLNSGRGQHRDMMAYLESVREENRRVEESHETHAVETAKDRAHYNRRRDLGIPMVPVLAKLEN